ncbi:MAG: DNA-directed RNA polymerase subunit D [Candidatus Wukongarchaeota archaeon]|nr:DNA-directed RNA polymerase subunit D [Candidatus Wukongarchaeota archaeon]
MEVKILKKTGDKIRFIIEGSDSALAGELRRIMMLEVPTLAVEWVDFVKNDSILWDEIIASRLGLIPLIFKPKYYKLKKDCNCKGKGCSHCQVTLSLVKKGPCTVYSGDLVPSDKKVKPVYEKIPIVELTEGQELKFEAIAQLGLGRGHAKWQASIVGYRAIPKITVGKRGDKKEYVERCPKKVFTYKKNKLKVAKPLECNLCMTCVDLSKGVIKVETNEKDFLFNLETASGLKPKEIVFKSIEILKDKLNEFSKDLRKLK